METKNFAQECCVLKDFVAILYAPDSGKYYRFGVEDLLDYEIRSGLSLVNDGFLEVEDPKDVSSIIDTNKNLWLHVFYVENEDVYLHRDFRVTNVIRGESYNKAAIRFDLIDSLSYIFSKTYETTQNIDFQSCFKKYYDKYFKGDQNWKEPSISDIKNFRVEYTLDVKNDISDLYNISLEKNFLESFSNELKNRGYFCYQESNIIRILNAKNISSVQQPGEMPLYKRVAQEYSNIPTYLYYSKFFEGSSINQMPKTDYFSVDYENKKLKIQESKIEDLNESKETQDTSGFSLKYSEVSDESKFHTNTYFNFLNNYGAYIVVPSRKIKIRLLNKIKIESYNPSSNDTIDKVGDLKRSGEFIITGYTNKIVNRNRLVSLVKVQRFDS